MNFINNYIFKITDLLNTNQKKEFKYFFFLFFLAMLLELLGVGMILPVLNLIVNQDFYQSSNVISSNFFKMSFSQNELIFSSIGLIFFIYVFKSLYLVLVYKKEVSFLKKIRVYLSKKLFTTYINLPLDFHIQTNSGNLIRNIADIKIFTDLIMHTLFIIVEGLILIGLVFLLTLYEPKGTLTALLILSVIGYLFNLTIKKRTAFWGKQRQIFEGQKIISTQQGLNSIKDVKILSKEDYFVNQFNKCEEIAAISSQNHNFMNRMPKIILEIAAITILLIFLILLIVTGQDFKNFLPVLGLFAVASFRIFPSIARIMKSYQVIKFGIPVVELLKKELERLDKNQIIYENDKKKISMEKSIEFKNVDFSFRSKRNFIFKNLNFKIDKGSFVGIYGDSGNGKTTFINLLLGLVPPLSGEILVDGNLNISKNLKSWQKNIGYVPQSISILEKSLKSNIAFGLNDEDINDELVTKLIERVKLQKFLSTLKEGINTVINENGENLSGGQKQRIGIARCLYNNPKLIVLDEATNALDKITAREIVEELIEIKRDKTLIIISHDLETLQKCEKIYKLEHGNLKLDNKVKHIND